MAINLVNSFHIHLFGEGAILTNGSNLYKIDHVQLDVLIRSLGEPDISTFSKKFSDDLKTIYGVKGYLENLQRIGVISENAQNALPATSGVAGRYYPLGLNIELTDACNLKCSHCYRFSGPHMKDFLDTQIIDYIADTYCGLIKNILLTGGEPTIHPQFEYIVNTLSSHFSLRMFTNGTKISKIDNSILHKFDYLRVSVYGIDRKTFTDFTSNDLFDEVLEGLRRLKNECIPFEILLVATESLLENLYRNLDFFISFRPRIIKILFPMSTGRGAENLNDNKDLQKQIATMILTYPNKEKIQLEGEDINRRCVAGSQSLCLSPNGFLRPCQLLPENYFKIGRFDYIEEYSKNLHIVNPVSMEYYVKTITPAEISNPCLCIKKAIIQMDKNELSHFSE